MVFARFFLSIKSRKGLSLVELVVTLAIMSILGALAYNFFAFNLTAYSNSRIRSQLQFDARMTSHLIASGLRNANQISISSASLSSPSVIELSDIQAKFPSVSNVIFKIVEKSGRYVVEYTITTLDSASGNQYVLESNVLINNKFTVPSANLNSPITAIYFTKPSLVAGGGPGGGGPGGSLTLSEILAGFTFPITNPNGLNPTISITPPANLDGASITALGSTGVHSAAISVAGQTATITRGTKNSNPDPQVLTITISASRDGFTESRTVNVSIPARQNNSDNNNHGAVSISN